MQRKNEVQHVFLVGAKSLGAYGGLGTQYLGFKVGNMLQIIFQGRNINWLEMYGVTEEENFGWKAIYFLCGILIPLAIIKGKDTLTQCLKMRRYDGERQSKDM